MRPASASSWQWAAAIYSQFSTDYTALNVKAVDDNHFGPNANSDHAGTPETDKSFVLGGARGGGGSNWTGSYSATGSVTPDIYVPPSATVSGFVYQDNDMDGAYEQGTDTLLQGVTVSLYNSAGQLVTTTMTGQSGDYQFSGLAAGTYTVVTAAPAGDNSETPGSVNFIVAAGATATEDFAYMSSPGS